MAKFNRELARKRRHLRLRKKISGTAQRPRLSVYRSLRHIHAQIIDDTTGHTLVAASSAEPELKGKLANGGNKEAAKQVGLVLASGPRKRTSARLCLIGRIYLSR